ncbi:hypothetical protein GCM10010289_10230 [Streptomyces violascens]|uniref:Uncharacterized protein n=2 Tax=Streptomyces violascens TaxID=67381 RepID=A0ABQ3QHC5_9ACTN|nr:hypothetical protein GCM10010289_10230 [Streptomyces violascens]GHI36688.1 hypothetical protein Sviol_10960 [Streptomyces violascens]
MSGPWADVAAYPRGMEQSEVLKRVIGILTEAGDYRRRIEEDDERGARETDIGIVTALLNETMPHIEIPADATPQEMATLVAREVGGAIRQLVAAFSLAFVALAQVHDSGEQDVTSADVLQDLALRAEEIKGDGPGEAAG